MSPRRRAIPKEIETQVLAESLRRCCLCYYLKNDKTERRGQIAHLGHDPSRSSFADLVFLCLEHHAEYDSRSSQHKGFTPGEVSLHRDKMYRELKAGEPPESPDALRRRFDFLDKPWHFTWFIEGSPELFAYKSLNRFDGVCRIERVDLADGRTAVICEEIHENPGQSTTNTIESIAVQLCRQFEIDPEQLVLIDHYFRHRSSWKEDWNVVEFGKRGLDGFEDPRWLELTDADWDRLGFRPRRRAAPPRPRSLIVRSRKLPLRTY